MKKLFPLVFLFLTACSSLLIEAEPDLINVVGDEEGDNSIDSLITPYRNQLEGEMNEVIAFAEHDFTKGRPNGSLNNWSADAVLTSVNLGDSIPVMCLLNTGGLRNPISKGDVKLEDIYKLMPFDNEVVVVEMPIESLKEISEYLQKSGGEPIAGAQMKAGELFFDGEYDRFFVVTSDYLLEGGDKMYFFQKHIKVVHTDVLMREAMIQAAKNQKTLIYSDEQRIKL